MEAKIKIKKSYRNLYIENKSIDEDLRTVTLSFSSEVPVRRWFGWEILDHDEKSVNLDRLNNAAAVMVDHWSDQIGVVEKAWIEDRKAYATLRFSKSARGEEVFNDIKDGIRKNVSFGYIVNSLEFYKKEDEKEYYKSYDWTPYEISIVSVPADYTVGVGRGEPELETEIEVKGKPTDETTEQNEDYSLRDAELEREIELLTITQSI